MERVEETAFDSLSCKWSMCSIGYLEGHSAITQLILTNETHRRRQSPLCNRFYWERVATIESVIDKYIEFHSGNKIQLLSIGAGLSGALLARCTSPIHKFHVHAVLELDTIAIVDAKRKMFPEFIRYLSSDCFNKNEIGNSIPSNYHLLAVDLRSIDELNSAIAISNLDVKLPTLIMSECVLCYLEPNEAFNVIQWTSKTFSQGLLFLHEPSGRVSFDIDILWKKLELSFVSEGCPIKCYPTTLLNLPDNVEKAFETIAISSMRDFSSAMLPYESKARIASLEPFDEHASLAAMQVHYAFAFCYNSIIYKKFIGFLERTSTPSTSLSANISEFSNRVEKLQYTISVERLDHQNIESFLPAIRNMYTKGLSELSETNACIRSFVNTSLNTDLSFAQISQELNSNTLCFWIAVLNDFPTIKESNLLLSDAMSLENRKHEKIIGCAAVAKRSHSIAELRNMTVADESRRKGVAKTLLRKCEYSVLNDFKCAEILLTTLSPMLPAQRLYESFGYRAIRKSKMGKGLESYCYKKNL